MVSAEIQLFFFFFLINLLICLFLLLAVLGRCFGVRASHCKWLLPLQSMWALGTRAQQLWRTGPVAPSHVRSSRTRDRTRVPCTGRRTPNRCATREVQRFSFDGKLPSMTPTPSLNLETQAPNQQDQ